MTYIIDMWKITTTTSRGLDSVLNFIHYLFFNNRSPDHKDMEHFSILCSCKVSIDNFVCREAMHLKKKKKKRHSKAIGIIFVLFLYLTKILQKFIIQSKCKTDKTRRAR